MDSSTLIQTGITFAGVVVGSGIIQFFINRKDKQKEDAKNDITETLRAEHKRDFQELQKAITKLVENDAKFTESMQKMAEQQDRIAQANVGMMHNTIIRFTDKIIARKSVTYEELATLDSLYVPYSQLGGNGECKRRYEDVNKLLKISQEEAVRRDQRLEAQKYKELQKVIGA